MGALKQVAPMLQLLAVNRDIFIRSLALLTVFFFFTAQGARLGDTVLAANAVLITFLLLLGIRRRLCGGGRLLVARLRLVPGLI